MIAISDRWRTGTLEERGATLAAEVTALSKATGRDPFAILRELVETQPVTASAPASADPRDAIVRSLPAFEAAVTLGGFLGARELSGVMDARWMLEIAADLPALPPWLLRMHGVTHAAKVVWAAIATAPDVAEADVTRRFGQPWVVAGWERYLEEVVSMGLVVRSSGRLRALRRSG